MGVQGDLDVTDLEKCMVKVARKSRKMFHHVPFQ